MIPQKPRAKVFISCGQREGLERETAKAIGAVLSRLGFDYYIAVEEASLKGLKENIYRQLETSEYLLFVDFAREKIEDPDDPRKSSRGSLFSHQELAVAAYLDLDWLPFQQAEVEQNGIMRFIQANVIRFMTPGDLPALVEGEVRNRLSDSRWSPDWKNALRLERDPTELADVPIVELGLTSPTPARWYHAIVRNLHRRKIALNCVAYVTEIRQSGGPSRVPKTNELVWAGYGEPTATIVSQSSRDLDLGFVLHGSPSVFHFHSHARSTRYADFIQGPGRFEIDYIVYAEKFPLTTATMGLTLGSTLTAIDLR